MIPEVTCEPAAAPVSDDWDTSSCLYEAPQITHQRFWPIEQMIIEEGLGKILQFIILETEAQLC